MAVDCRKTQENIMPFIREELPEEQLEGFMQHIDSCSECKEELEISYSIYWGLHMLQDDANDSFHIQRSLEKFLQKTRDHIARRHRRHRFLFGLFIGFLVLVVLFFAFQFVRMLQPQWLDFFM